MEEVIEGDTSEQKTIEIGQQSQEPVVQQYTLELTFPIKGIVTTSDDKKKSKYDTGYTKIQFFFENDVSVQIIFETYYSFNEKKKTIYENAKYQVRIHKGDKNRYINLENDTKWAKLHQDYESKMKSKYLSLPFPFSKGKKCPHPPFHSSEIKVSSFGFVGGYS